MTRMFPPDPPSTAPRGEIDVFEAIRDAAQSEGYSCLHSLALAQHDSKEYAEADFVIVGPEGVFSIEAKGGEVVRRGGVWTIGPKGNTYESKEGPFRQSEKTVWPIRRHLEGRLGLGRDDVLVGWGVAFPHVTFSERSPDWDQDVVYDERDRAASFTAYISRLARYHEKRALDVRGRAPPRLSSAGVQNVVKALCPDISAVPTVRGLIGDSQRQIAKLSQDQFRVLDFALNERNPQIICDGPAGTGKTLIAMEAARRLSADGKKVLVLCFNRQLARTLQAEARSWPQPVAVGAVHNFMADIIKRGGYAAHLKSAPTDEKLFEEVYPTFFEKAAEALMEEGELPQFDALVLDEAQDFLTLPILNALDIVLQNGFRRGRWLICLDTGLQAGVYSRMSEGVLATLREAKPAEFPLTQNFRNPKNLVNETCVITKAEKPECMRDLPTNVDYRVFREEADQPRKLKALVVELLKQGVAPGHITILSARSGPESCVGKYGLDVGKDVCLIEGQEAPPADCLTAASVSGFKGLENEVIILTDVPALEPMTDWGRSILYVGMTRARAKLYMIIDEAFLDARTRC